MDCPRLSRPKANLAESVEQLYSLRPVNAKLQESFASAVAPQRRPLPCSVLDDFDLRTVEDAHSLR